MFDARSVFGGEDGSLVAAVSRSQGITDEHRRSKCPRRGRRPPLVL